MENKKPAESVNSQAGYNFAASCDAKHHSSNRSRIKALIVALAVNGVFSYPFASWIIQRGGLRHD